MSSSEQILIHGKIIVVSVRWNAVIDDTMINRYSFQKSVCPKHGER